ncbi:hypothetical protein [Candidatus Odyssella thessalonicensis]|uniref:hypothetical protein n=1 Tax=Candidatus Odyssella thessalonicensis TaxID=84647 RepID=UPI000301D6D8|nr:hypothetical protein [Candidatus Odyssella thessalonicensis]
MMDDYDNYNPVKFSALRGQRDTWPARAYQFIRKLILKNRDRYNIGTLVDDPRFPKKD